MLGVVARRQDQAPTLQHARRARRRIAMGPLVKLVGHDHEERQQRHERRREEADEPPPTAEQLEEPAPFFELVEHAEMQAGHAERDKQKCHTDGQQSQHAEHENHQVHQELETQSPQRSVDLEPDRVVDEHHPGQLVHGLIEQGVAEDIFPGCRVGQISARRECGDKRRQNERRQRGRNK